MRIDRDFISFGGHFEWYTLDTKRGYIPKPGAPKEIVEAMERYNKIHFPQNNK